MGPTAIMPGGEEYRPRRAFDFSNPESLLGRLVALNEVQLFSPHPLTGDLKSGEVVEVNPDTLTAKVRCEIEVPIENLVRLT